MVRPVAPAIPASMYRHFAVITIALTSALALFADGETRATADEDVPSQRQDDTERLANQDGFSAPRRAASAPVGAGEFAEETGL